MKSAVELNRLSLKFLLCHVDIQEGFRENNIQLSRDNLGE